LYSNELYDEPEKRRRDNSKEKDKDPSAKGKAEGMIAARNHDEINLVLVSGLMGLTLYAFFFHNIYEDALNARLHTIDLSFPRQEYYNNPNRIYFWLNNRTDKNPENWVEPRIYTFLAVSVLLYTIFDTFYLLLVPACTTKAWTLIPHHIATICLTGAAIYLK
jgi:hypothetical protein